MDWELTLKLLGLNIGYILWTWHQAKRKAAERARFDDYYYEIVTWPEYERATYWKPLYEFKRDHQARHPRSPS